MVGPAGVAGKAKDAYDKIVKKHGYAPILLKGPFKTPQNFPGPGVGVLEEAYKAYQLGNTFRGGEKRGLACMASSVGFTALQSVNVRRMLTLLGIAIPLIADEKKVQIYCNISDVVLLNSSLKHFVPGCDPILTLVADKDFYKLDDKARLLVTQKVVDGTIAIRYLEQSVPNVGQSLVARSVMRNACDDYVTISEKGHSKYVTICPIVSEFAFQEGRKVYCFRSPWDFCGIMTNLKDDLMQAVSYDKIEHQTRAFVQQKTPQDFFKEVISSNARMNVMWLSRTVPFSPVSNLLVPPKKGYSAILSSDGELQYTHVVDSGYLNSKVSQSQGDEIKPSFVSLETLDEQRLGKSIIATAVSAGSMQVAVFNGEGAMGSSSSTSSGVLPGLVATGIGDQPVVVPPVVLPKQEEIKEQTIPIAAMEVPMGSMDD